jgi:hypothetical protein
MALITSPGPIIRDSIGSLTQLLIPLTTGSTSDTFNLGTNLPVVSVEMNGGSTSAGTSNVGDATYVASTGLVTLVSANQGAVTLVVQLRT